MKQVVVPFLFLTLLHAEQTSAYQIPLDTGIYLLIFLSILITLIVLAAKTARQARELREKEEKIQWLRQVNAQNEQRHTEKIQAMEKEILTLQHTIETLEIQRKEGTRNQVVAKIEALQHRRDHAQKHLNTPRQENR